MMTERKKRRGKASRSKLKSAPASSAPRETPLPSAYVRKRIDELAEKYGWNPDEIEDIISVCTTEPPEAQRKRS